MRFKAENERSHTIGMCGMKNNQKQHSNKTQIG